MKHFSVEGIIVAMATPLVRPYLTKFGHFANFLQLLNTGLKHWLVLSLEDNYAIFGTKVTVHTFVTSYILRNTLLRNTRSRANFQAFPCKLIFENVAKISA